MVATPACHAPFTPAPQYKNNFNSSKAPRTPAFNVAGGPVSELFFEFSLFWYIQNPIKVSTYKIHFFTSADSAFVHSWLNLSIAATPP